MIADEKPDVILMDLNMPGMGGETETYKQTELAGEEYARYGWRNNIKRNKETLW